MSDYQHDPFAINRRHFFNKSTTGIGGMALASILARGSENGIYGLPTSPKAKRVIYLFQSGGPSQYELFDNKPHLRENHGVELPKDALVETTGMSSNQSSLPMAGSVCTEFNRHGKSGQEMSDFIPWHHKIADDICIMKNVYTDAINHDPAITFIQTGNQIAGRPCIGSWLSYGLGTDNSDLPNFIVMVSKNGGGQPLYSRLWGSGFLDSRHQGVKFLAGEDRVLFLNNPEGITRENRRTMLNKLNALNYDQFQRELDPEIESRIAQYEMSYRMQASVPEVSDTTNEPQSTWDLYGEGAKEAGTYAANCLQARRLAERGVQFIQLYHQGWDAHGGLPGSMKDRCKKTDRGSAALVMDLKQRGLLDDTLVVWGGEFGRTAFSQGKLSKTNYGRDHHKNSFSMWMAGGGIKGGITVGKTDKYGSSIVDTDGNPVKLDKHHKPTDAIHVHDLQATMLHLLGIDHERLSYKFQGRRFRLTDVHGFKVDQILA
ncbi:DUF1501 domain-containing protein [Akkermansiaceae bacterium]|nr:DUF1501 domain-containing protein [Akkermansiaceae bacterium]